MEQLWPCGVCVNGLACLMPVCSVPVLEQNLMHMVFDIVLKSINVFINEKVSKMWPFLIERELLTLFHKGGEKGSSQYDIHFLGFYIKTCNLTLAHIHPYSYFQLVFLSDQQLFTAVQLWLERDCFFWGVRKKREMGKYHSLRKYIIK